MSEFDYDLFIVGAGSAGVRAGRLAATSGARVAIAEERRVGGTCVLRGCVPKKLLVIGSHFAEDFADAPAYGWTVPTPSFDWPRLIAAKNRELDRLHGIYRRLLSDAGVTVLEGRAKLAGPGRIGLGSRTISAERIIVATGGWPVLPDIPGIGHAITSNEALDLPALPKRLAIVGGGYIAVEFAGLFNALGVEVTLFTRGDLPLRGFDEDVRLTLAEEMAKKGIAIRSRTRVSAIERGGDGTLRLDLVDQDGSAGRAFEADCVLYATGRHPNSRGIGLEETGVAVDELGAIRVDEFSQTSVPGIFALGDVTNRMALTPVALAEARCLIEGLYHGRPRAMDYSLVPSAVFSQPAVATVGLGEAAARQRWGEVDIYVTWFRSLRHTLTGRDEQVMMKLVVKRDDQRVVGCHMVGAEAPEIVQGLAVALTAGATKKDFDATIGIHPTVAEEWVTLREKRPETSL
ncbi:glutathione-disulfide reductase [Telmatospirillum siberiense]|uniref:Glutathione-disulfide reductase n=1 Tax=Telmatospirillum siberiense TaxID=382514 RepID=A0A2N3PXF5_9PROT|nr:glutathione-disulfide reductase [Telmatospirillum siberiense]PKU25065.1 glutathione-disulfide reductase [Telmatospirillum siberiense]